MDIAHLIKHPELLDRESLYDLRSLIALYPYYQTARLLLLQNLYILHDPSFNDELRDAALYISDRRVIFNLIEAAHYQLPSIKADEKTNTGETNGKKEDRTISLIDNFLDSIPEEENNNDKEKRRKPTPADAAIDYVSYLIDIGNTEEQEKEEATAPLMKGQNLIDNFINNEGGKIQLKEMPEFLPAADDGLTTEDKDDDEGYFTETLAKIYIKQGRYNKALEIIQRLNLNYPKKNAYFADQIRFLEKVIANNKHKK